jgi:hypothetical protein
LRLGLTLSSERLLLVRAEDVYSGDKRTLSRLFDFIGAPLPAERRIARVLGKRLNAQSSGSFPAAADWTAAMLREARSICGDVAQRCGYEFD